MTNIDWIKMPAEPWNAIEGDETHLIYLATDNRVISAYHDAVNRWFVSYEGEEERIIPYSSISHYAEMDWPDINDGPMISWCEHGNLLVCEECAERHRDDRNSAGEAGGRIRIF